jgi:YVTN family beta-propeller protein
MAYNLGVDLGTTFVAAAIARPTQIEMFTLGDHSPVTPALVYLLEDGVLVTGDAAGRRAVANPERLGREFKRRLGDPTPIILGGSAHPVTELLGTLLRDVLAKVGATQRGLPPEKVVLTHPANWGPFRRGLFEEVPAAAGLDDAMLITEPEAAGLHYASSHDVREGEIVAVYDLGGGTFDASVLRKGPDGVEIIGTPEGIERLGGIDFDESILSYVNFVGDGVLDDLDMRDPRTIIALARLRHDCVQAKEALSVDTETTIPVFLPVRHFEVQLTRARFEGMVRAQIESTIGALARTLRSARIAPDELSAVLLVGGSSRIPLVAKMVSEELGRPTVVDINPKYSVALGAATLAGPPSANGRAGASASARRAATVVRSAPEPAARVDADGAGAPTGAVSSRAAGVAALAGAAVETTMRGLDQAGPAPSAAGTGAAAQRPRPAGPRGSEDRGTPRRGARLGATQPGAAQPGAVKAGTPPPALASAGRGGAARWVSRSWRGAALVGVVGVVLLLAVPVIHWSRSGSPATPAPGAVAAAPPAASAVVTSVPVPSLGTPIQVGATPNFVTLSPNGRLAYVANADAETVTVVDTSINRVIATIPVPAGPPRFLTFAPDGRRVYVSIFNDQRTIHAIGVIDTTTDNIVATIPVATRPFRAAITADGTRLYVPNHDSGTIEIIDTRTDAVVAEIKVPPNPHWIEFSRDGTRAYMANHESNLVSVLDVATNAVIAQIPVGASPHALAVHPSRPLVANVNYDGNTVTMIDTNTNRVTATIPVGKQPQSIRWAPDGRFAYVVNDGDGTLSVINTDTDRVTATIPTGGSPTSVAVLPDGREAYVSNLDSGTLSVLNTGG